MAGNIQISKIAKICCVVFLFYVTWFRYAYNENHIILYVSVFGAVGCMLLDIIVSGGDFRNICPTGVIVNLVMCVYSVVTGIWTAINYDSLLNLAKTYATFSLICITICYISKVEGSIDWIISTLIYAGVLISLYVIFRGYPFVGYGYVLGPDNNPNLLGLLMDINLFCLAYKASRNKKRIPLYLGIATLFLFIIVNSGSRKSLLAAAIIIGLWIFPLLRELWKGASTAKRTILVFSALFLLGGAIYYFTTKYVNTDSFQRMALLGDEKELSSVNRKLYYSFAMDYYFEHPLFGIGLGQFVFWNPYNQMAHSTYAEAIADWGTIGTIIYFLPIIVASIQAVVLVSKDRSAYVPRILLALIVMELFLGIGQVWFYEIEHLITWTLIYYLIDDLIKQQEEKNRMVCKYVKG